MLQYVNVGTSKKQKRFVHRKLKKKKSIESGIQAGKKNQSLRGKNMNKRKTGQTKDGQDSGEWEGEGAVSGGKRHRDEGPNSKERENRTKITPPNSGENKKKRAGKVAYKKIDKKSGSFRKKLIKKPQKEMASWGRVGWP